MRRVSSVFGDLHCRRSANVGMEDIFRTGNLGRTFFSVVTVTPILVAGGLLFLRREFLLSLWLEKPTGHV